MRILVIEPGRHPYVSDIPCDYQAMQSVVNGDIACTYPWEDPVGLVHNDNAIAEGRPYNRALIEENTGHIYDIVRGTFFLAGLGEEDFTDLPEEYIQKYRRLFYAIEHFYPI